MHSENKKTYSTDEINNFLKDYKSQISLTGPEWHGNQVSEAVNNQLKTLIGKRIIPAASPSYRNSMADVCPEELNFWQLSCQK